MKRFRQKSSHSIHRPDLRDNCVPGLVAAWALTTPAALAVTAELQELTYGELDRRANRLARDLRSRGVGPDVLVGLCVPRSADLVIGALGVWKAGGAYVPMDPAYPPERLAFMLDDAQAAVLISSSRIAGQLPATGRETVHMDAPQVASQSADVPSVDTANT